MDTVLVGDVGGTSCRFAVAHRSGGEITLTAFAKYQNDDHTRFSGALNTFLADLGTEAPQGQPPTTALFALAGPLQEDGSVTLTNRDWPTIHPDDLKSRTGLARVTLVNDFAAMARAVPEMPPAAFETILPGTPKPSAPILVTGPGTGFGVSTLITERDGRYRVMTGEGGHAAYAAHTPREAEIAACLAAEHGFISTEAVVSGAWLQPVFDIVSDLHGRARANLPAADILARADAGDPVCVEVCELRGRAIMGAAGDAALITGAQGGVVLTGGVAERMGKWLRSADAEIRFRGRGARTPWMAPIPVSVLHADEAPLTGAAALAFDLA
ncbi:MAG: ROK family protein [Pseudomonadota bacterium]